MRNVKFNGIIKEILENPNRDVVELLQDKLRLPLDKAEVLADRIQKAYLQKADAQQKTLKAITEKHTNPKEPKKAHYTLESLSNKEFEGFTKWLLQESGYDIHPEKIPTIQGVDYIATKNGVKTAVLARKFPKSCVVTEVAVLMAVQSKRIYQCSEVIVLATTDFSEQAKLDAEKAGVMIWDSEALDEKILNWKNRVGSCLPIFIWLILPQLIK